MAFFGAKWSEPILIAIAYGVEQKVKTFYRPKFLPTLPTVAG
ncbi:hypothetical protein [Luteibacter yeojuensis]|nr:hypothetical protein [Luteibacter yeojuensis]